MIDHPIWYVNSLLDWARVVVIISCTVTLLVGASRVRYWRRVSRASLLFRGSLFAFLVATIIGTWEQLAVPAPPPGVRTYLFLLASAWAFSALLFERYDEHHQGEPEHGKSHDE